MRKIIRLTESDLIKLVKRVISEQPRAYDHPALLNVENELLDLGFKYKRENSLHNFEYNSGQNLIRVIVNTSARKPYSVLSIMTNSNYIPKPGYEKDSWGETITDINKEYSENEYKQLISDVTKSKQKIKTA
jgi:hypothetical protein